MGKSAYLVGKDSVKPMFSKKRTTRRLDPIATSNKKTKTSKSSFPGEHGKSKVFNPKELEDVLRKISQTPLATEVRSSKVKEAPTVVNATATEVQNLRNNVSGQARKYNEAKLRADLKEKQLAVLKDNYADLSKETKSLRLMAENRTWGTKRISHMQEEVAKTENQIQNSLFYREQLAFMSKRLNRNHKTMEKHLHQLETGLNNSKTELQHLSDLRRELEAAKNKVLVEIQNKKILVARELKVREKTLADRAQEAVNASRMEKWRTDRKKMKSMMHAEALGDMSKEDEELLLVELEASEKYANELKAEFEEEQRKASHLETAFDRIRQATGVKKLDEMVEKFEGQESSRQTLDDERAKMERQLANLVSVRSSIEEGFAQLKSEGVGNTELTKEIYKKIEKQIDGVKARMKVNQATVNRLEIVLRAAHQGAIGLQERMASFAHVLTAVELKELKKNKTKIKSVDTLNKCQLQMMKLMEATSEKNHSAKPVPSAADLVIPPFDATLAETEVHEHNCRVRATMDALNSSRSVTSTASSSTAGLLSARRGVDMDASSKIWDRNSLKKDAKKLLDIEKKRLDLERRVKEQGAAAAALSSISSPAAKKRKQEDSSLRLLTAGSRRNRERESHELAQMFLTEMPALL